MGVCRRDQLKTQREIIEKVKETELFFGWEIRDLLKALDAESLESLRGPVLKEDADLSKLNRELKSDDDVRRAMIGHMKFAFGKANSQRGISAGRSIEHYSQWLWLIGEDDLASEIEEYDNYGIPQLEKVCEFLNIDPKSYGGS